MRWKDLVLFAAVALLMVACSSTPESSESANDQAARETASDESAITFDTPLEDLPPDYPLWPEGVTFNDSTRVIVLHARTLALHALVEREREMHGPELAGMVNVRMIIQPDGSVSSVDLIDDKWSNPYAVALTDSIIAIIEQWTFPPGLERPLALEQPFKFTP